LTKDYKYFYGSEMLRTEFHNAPERIQPQKLTIVTTSSAAVYKGYDMILKTAKVLKANSGDNFTWKVFGNVVPDFYEKMLGIRHEDVNVELCGVAKPAQLVEAFSNCTAYFHPSYIENSPNSVCEAQLSGCPVVACYIGGNDTLVKHGEEGFLVPANDPYMAAARVIQLHEDRELNKRMGEASKTTASKRHDRATIVNGLIDIYKQIIETEKA
jgi:glycosyltransferase involved in cell wall biosynthesis